ncbi:hypothetical protein N7468_004406 [Penicillium chermesinum]|uniref:Uncharacterized protein n=1 Tax=Penicillium chermesinum TaxID=63820 RepID=A0A9W9PBC9_9EURO|nr:uncharacterized protein N7468_004406 [Penicillium chermesinum]KAJ5239787.1 hypothetical protein N7468_004406 [Penicillium chermesinum]KAJ6166665.1 hypothetical protein N7470_002112 [Penicillium chermesinum]
MIKDLIHESAYNLYDATPGPVEAERLLKSRFLNGFHVPLAHDISLGGDKFKELNHSGGADTSEPEVLPALRYLAAPDA